MVATILCNPVTVFDMGYFQYKHILQRGLLICLLISSPLSYGKDQFHLAWYDYIGWQPWGYAVESGILRKWADKYDIAIEASRVAKYDVAVERFLTGEYDAATATNIDILVQSQALNADVTALIIGDYSNGNDGIIARGMTSFDELSKQKVLIADLPVSHFLLHRALSKHEIDYTAVVKSTVDEQQLEAQFANQEVISLTTWNPILQRMVELHADVNLLFSSKQIPGEILDMTFVHSKVDRRFKKALCGAWYEVMDILRKSKHPQHADLITYMAKISNSTSAGVYRQLENTAFYTKARRASSFARSPALKSTMEYVRYFAYHSGLFKGNLKPERMGIQYPDGSVNGNKQNIVLRFTDRYMLMAANNRL